MRARVFSTLAVAALAACTSTAPPQPPTAASPKASWSGLDQGWTDQEKEAFWFTPQGSWLVPYRWFLELEEPGGTGRFRDDAHLERLGYLTAEASAANPDGLPIGFVKDRGRQDGHEMLGFTCAACHTSRIELDGKAVQVEGGPTLSDFQALLDDLVAALEATTADQQQFQRFAANVVGTTSGDKADALRRDVAGFTAKLAERKKRNDPPHPYGRGRVDALGNILNEVLVADLGVAENQRPADAPVSYPVMWDAHQQDFVQWNGSAPNQGPGPLLRNIGEVLGVFGHMEFTPRRGRLPIYRNATPDVENLKKIEALVEKLESPLWPDSFPAVDREKAEAGRSLFARECESCHPPVRRADPNRRIKVTMVAAAQVGTDPVAADNFIGREARTGVLKGTPVFVDPLQSFGDTAPAGFVLRNAVFGVQLGKFSWPLPHPHPIAIPSGGVGKLLEKDWLAFEQKLKDQKTAIETLVGKPPQLTTAMYKARPLNGVWASSPYLHNGSVPTLWELLKRPADRRKSFHVGTRKYDPVEVGFQDLPSDGAASYFRFDTSVRGNSNAGHPYGTQLEDDQKRQLVEYLKTL